VGVGAFTVMTTVPVVLPPELVAVTVNTVGPEVVLVGVPEIFPDELVKVNPVAVLRSGNME
jgi:hypothetical protein